MGMKTKNASVEISTARTDQLTVAGIDNAGDSQRRSSSNFNGIQMGNRFLMGGGGDVPPPLQPDPVEMTN
jgi:hypothetical protein